MYAISLKWLYGPPRPNSLHISGRQLGRREYLTLSYLMVGLKRAVFVASLLATPLRAQSLREAVTDSAMVNFVAVGVFKVLPYELGLASQGWSAPWVITMPDTSARWNGLRQQLWRALNARDTSSTDRQRMMLTIGAPTIESGTRLIGWVKRTSRFRCDSTWRNSGTTYQLSLLRSDGNAFHTVATPTIAEDSSPCRRPD